MMKKYRISSIKDMSPSVKVFILEPMEGRIGFSAGQFAFIHILDENGETVVKRPYSIASAPEEEKLEFCIKLVGGEMTGRLEKMAGGEVVGIDGGHGHFNFLDQKKAGFIAGGTGIAPIIGILRHVVKSKAEGDYVVFYSVKTKDDILYNEELKRLGKHPGIRVIITLTRAEWEGHTGRICHDLISRYIPNGADYNWWVCGPMGLIKAMKQCLLSLEAEPENIKLEGWG
jgi:phenol hydroxylase P5 protein